MDGKAGEECQLKLDGKDNLECQASNVFGTSLFRGGAKTQPED